MIEILVFSIKGFCIFILLFPFYIFFMYMLQKLSLFGTFPTCISFGKKKYSLQVKSITKEE
jgi:hypothetical protein